MADCGRGGERFAVTVGFVLLALALGLPCGSGCRTPEPATPPARPVGALVVACEPGDASVYVDDRFQGSVASLKTAPLSLTEGVHRIEIRREGYFSHYSEVTVSKGVRQSLEVRLRKEPF